MSDMTSKSLSEEAAASEEEFDLGHKISDLEQKSDHPVFETVGYIRWVEDNIDEADEIVVQVNYPNDNYSFKESIDFPADFNRPSKLRSLIRHPDLPFSKGSFNNSDLQDEPGPIDIEDDCINVPEHSRLDSLPGLLQNIVEMVLEKGVFVSIVFGLCYILAIVSITAAIWAIISLVFL